MDVNYDVVIIGSGFGGAVTACRLALAGYKVLVLERGRRWNEPPTDTGIESWIWSQKQPERKNGWLDFRLFPRMAVIQGAGVGGGSHIFSGVMVDASPDVFRNGWPTAITDTALKPYYDKVSAMMALKKLPMPQFTPRTKLVKEAAGQAGFEAHYQELELAVTFNEAWHYNLPDPHSETHARQVINAHQANQRTCIHQGGCNVGCSVKAKNTLDLNYLHLAEQEGASVWASHVVRFITPRDNGHGYTVHFDHIRNGRLEGGQVPTRLVIVAAGSLGSTELLLRCRDEYRTLPRLSDALGQNWSPNGDVISLGFYADRALLPARGPVTTAAISFLDQHSIDDHHFFIQEAGYPDLLLKCIEAEENDPENLPITRIIVSMLRGFLERQARGSSHIMPWFAQGRDAANGTLRLRKNQSILADFLALLRNASLENSLEIRPVEGVVNLLGGIFSVFARESTSHLGSRFLGPSHDEKTLDLKWDVTRSEATIQAIVDMHRNLTEKTDGRFIESPLWEQLKYLITTHPLGGCGMADHPSQGVVNAEGEVFGYNNLYVADGSIIPTALGLNPAKTIAALAERISETIIQQNR